MADLGKRDIRISIHALLAESDNVLPAYAACGENFYPRSPCGERRLNLPSKPIDKNISIHALLAESDRSAHPDIRQRDAISIHALLAESDFDQLITQPEKLVFLSTLSLRRATNRGKRKCPEQ